MNVYTLEVDDKDDDRYVVATRHAECVARTDMGYCIVLDVPPDVPPEDAECWGCNGWLDQPPLTPDETRNTGEYQFFHRLGEWGDRP